MRSHALFLTLVAGTLASAIPKNEEGHKNRVIDKPELSDQDHFKDLDEEREHNPDYDHEAFLGKEEAQTFDDLSPAEAKHRLGLIFEKIDKDGDGLVEESELENWIKHVQNRYVLTDTERQWNEFEPQGNTITWEEYKKRTYGDLEEEDDDEDDEDDDGYSYKEMMLRDERRWARADTDGDGQLNKQEFADFLHPEDAEHMRDIVIEETMEDIDEDKDGFISVQEYIGDMWPSKDGEDEPDWVHTEREQFLTFRDKNKDGKMDREEVEEWIMPPDYDHTQAEAKHLIYESDTDKDGKLTRDEVVDKYDLFVGSQATDFGEALAKHDEF